MSAASGWTRRLHTRLFLSYVVVVVVGAVTMLIVGTAVTRTVYEGRIGGFGFGGQGRSQGQSGPSTVTEDDLRTALDASLVPALLAGAAAALVAAGLVAWFVARRLLRPLDEVRVATRRLAAGDHDIEVPVPVELELASLAEDVNELGAHLAGTERRRTELLAEVTHELRTPITLIRGRMEGLLDGVVEPTDEVYLGVAAEAARLQRVVDDLSLLSRADEGALDIQAVPTDLGELALGVAERLRPQFEHASVRLDVGEPVEPVVVLGDADRLTQVLTNLLGNALGHTPSGGAVTVAIEPGGEVGRVEIVDTGSGIPVDDLERIFERFYRGPDQASRRRPGRGLGLSIARSIARAHGGDVTASSSGPGTGARFVLTVPVA